MKRYVKDEISHAVLIIAAFTAVCLAVNDSTQKFYEKKYVERTQFSEQNSYQAHIKASEKIENLLVSNYANANNLSSLDFAPDFNILAMNASIEADKIVFIYYSSSKEEAQNDSVTNFENVNFQKYSTLYIGKVETLVIAENEEEVEFYKNNLNDRIS